MSPHQTERTLALSGRVTAGLARLRGAESGVVCRWWVPGRIEVLGKHTDYAGGRSLLCATERGICIAAAPRSDDRLHVHDATTGETLDESMTQHAVAETQSPPGHWSNYVRTVALRVARNFAPPLAGADVVLASDLPQAAGMSSSSALVIAMFLALSRVNDLESRDEYRRALPTREHLAEYVGTIENGQSFGELAGERGVGTFGGSEDHTAILCARAGMLMQYAFCPVRLERIAPVPAGHVFVVATSGVAAEKTGAMRDRYNRLSTMITEILRRWESVTGERYVALGAAVDALASAEGDIRLMLRSARGAAGTDDRRQRFDHFLLESNELIPAATDALVAGNLGALGAIVDRSQDAAARLLGNQVPETQFLARYARELGAVAASAFGAGFGGSVWALVPEADASAFLTRWADAYATRFPAAAARSEGFITRAGPGMLELGGDS